MTALWPATSPWIVRPEVSGDEKAIGKLIDAAFKGHPHSDGSEAAIVARLRAAHALAVSLVAETDGGIVGHIAFSPVTIEGGSGQWFGLAPVSVRPAEQRRGIGAELVANGLEWIKALGAGGCVVLGEPEYYGRFGFRHDPALSYAGAPDGYFQRLAFGPAAPEGAVHYHPAFGD